MSMMLSCSHTVRLYPVQGPLSVQKPLPVLVAKITGFSSPKNISAILSDGEVCKGVWNLVPQAKIKKGVNTTIATTTNEMSSIWDTVYGPEFYVSHILGARYYARAVASGNRGTVLNVELYSSGGESVDAIKGIAKDNQGNIYKLVF